MALFSNAVQLVTPGLIVAEGGGFHPPSIDDFFPPAIFFEGTPFEMNRIMLIRVIMMLVVLALFWAGTRKMKVVPGRFQSLTEMALDFVRVNIAEDLLGKTDGRRFLPVLSAIFFMIISFNITGIIPGFNVGVSAVVGVPLVLAIVSWVAFPVIPAIVALVLASKATKEIRASNGWLTGEGMALAAKIMSWINIGFAILATIFVIFLIVVVAASGGFEPSTVPSQEFSFDFGT